MRGWGKSSLKQRTLVMAGLAAVVIVALTISQTISTYRETVATAQRSAQQLTQILEANTDITLQSMELILDRNVGMIASTPPENRKPPLFTERFTRSGDKWSFVHSIAFIEADGIIRSAVIRGKDGHLQPHSQTVDANAMRIFNTHRNKETPNGKLYIARAGRDMTSLTWVITITKAVYERDGTFLGAVLVTISVDTLVRGLVDLLPERYSSAELFRRDGTVLVSSQPDRSNTLTENETTLFDAKIPAATDGFYHITSRDGTEDSIVSYAVLKNYPVVLVVTGDWSRIVANWRNSALLLAVSAMAGLSLIMFVTWRMILGINAGERAQHALIMNEQRMALAQRFSGVGYFETGLDMKGPAVWSDNMYAIHQVDPAAFAPSGGAFLEMVLEEDRHKILEIWANPRKDLTVVEVRIKLSDGVHYMRYSWKFMDEGAQPLGKICGVAQDVTVIRIAEDAVRAEEERLREIVDIASDYIWEVNADDIITFYNASAIEQFGDIRGLRSGSIHYSADDNDPDDGAILQECTARRAKFRGLIIPVRNRMNEIRWLRMSGNPRFDGNGTFLGYRGVSADITELRRKQEQDEAARKAEAVGQLANGMAHEINNLLQPIMIYANIGATQEGIAANIRTYFQRIGRAAERSMLIVKNVLAFARQSPPTRENVGVLDVVRETVDLIGGTLAPGTTLSIAGNAGNTLVRVDRTGLGQVLTNLLTNAGEALPSGGDIKVSVDVIELTADAAAPLSVAAGLYCRMTVEDNGSGIPKSQIGKVFDPFFTTKPQGKGTGLGLSVVSGLAKSWDGAATVESIEGVRTSFSIYLPLVEQQMQAAQ